MSDQGGCEIRPCNQVCDITQVDKGTKIVNTEGDPFVDAGGNVWTQTVQAASGPVTMTFTLPAVMSGVVNGQTANGLNLEHLTLSDTLTGDQTVDVILQLDRPLNECEDLSITFFDIDTSESLTTSPLPEITTGVAGGDSSIVYIWDEDPGPITVTTAVVNTGISVAFRIREVIRECCSYAASCVDCGLDYADGQLSAKTDGTLVDCTDDGMRVTTPVRSTKQLAYGGGSVAFPYPDGCNGLSYDCETGRLWAPTRPCAGFKSDGGFQFYGQQTGPSFFQSSEVVALPTAAQAGDSNVSGIFECPEGDCFKNHKIAVCGQITIETSMTALDGPGDPDANFPWQLLDSHTINYDLTFLTPNNGILTSYSINENVNYEHPNDEVRIIDNIYTHHMPFVFMYDFCDRFKYRLNAEVNSAFGNNGPAQNFVTKSNLYMNFAMFYTPECD